MKATINRSGCISCSLCAIIAPEIFRMAEDGLAEVYKDSIPAGQEQLAIEAKDGCPVSVISLDYSTL